MRWLEVKKRGGGEKKLKIGKRERKEWLGKFLQFMWRG